MGLKGELSVEDYMLVAQLVAIMRISNCLDQSYLQKIKAMTAVKKDDELVLTVEAEGDFTLERGVFRENVDFFEEIFNLKPVLRIKVRR